MAKPFLKWAGGKSSLLETLLTLAPAKSETYYEPFLGGGALFFALAEAGRFRSASLNDFNADLVNCYRVVRDSTAELIQSLKDLPISKEVFDDFRLDPPTDPISAAAAFIYLNKTCFNGLYRVNSKGIFNTPFGDFGARIPRVLDEVNLLACSKILASHASLYSGDFEAAVSGARAGDFVFMDPPHMPRNPTSSFTGYTSKGFGLEEQRRVAKCFRDLVAKGVSVIVSNADTLTIRELFDGSTLYDVSVRRNINSKGDARGPVGEVLVASPDIADAIQRAPRDDSSSTAAQSS